MDLHVVLRTNFIKFELTFLKLGAEAVERFKNNKGLADYDHRYEQNINVDRVFLKDYINLRRDCGIFENDRLIVRYVDITTALEMIDYEEVLFIFKAGPVIDSNPYHYVRRDYKIVDSIYKNELLPDRIWMNTHMINNTLFKAIGKKDHDLYARVSSFIYQITPDYDVAKRQVALNDAIFYRAINDTVNYYSRTKELTRKEIKGFRQEAKKMRERLL
jgi:hypothetical protein